MKIRLPLLMLLCVAFMSNLRASPPIGAVVSADYDSVKKVTTLHIVNTSQKEIVAINLTLAIPMADGTISTASQKTFDWMRNAETVNGILPGGRYDYDLPPRDEGKVDAIVDVVVYADDTAEVRNHQAFETILASRKAQAVGKQKIDDLMADALASAPEGQRAAVVLGELKTLYKNVVNAKDVPWKGRGAYAGEISSAIQDMTNISQSAQKTGNVAQEASSLRYLVDRNSREIELLTRHVDVKEVRQ